MCRGEEKKKSETQCEREIWENMTPAAWHLSIAKADSIFLDTYEATRAQIEHEVLSQGYDVIVEVGCGTGDIIGKLNIDVPKLGIDINPEFIEFCEETHGNRCDFQVVDAIQLNNWWKKVGGKYKKPLITCVNNTLNIMPEELRGVVISQMLQVAGSKGRCLVTYWNGHFFSHALLNYYKENSDLCGNFDVKKHVDWDQRQLLTPGGYSTEWMLPKQVQKLMRSYDVDVEAISTGQLVGQDHVNLDGLAIFLWFSQQSTSSAKSYYDSDDAQTFYSKIWGTETVHIGRHDLITESDRETLSKHKHISLAQDLHETEFIKLIRSKFGDQQIRIVDLGCGYGGLLRRLHEAGVVWSATGCDISAKMCDQARMLNSNIGCDGIISILEESYLDVSVPSESADLVISMDALLHVGPERQHRAIQEASRILRPGGWMIFTDIMEQAVVDPVEMQPIYDRIHLSKLGTVLNYENAMRGAGFSGFEFIDHSLNVSAHYGSVLEVLVDKGASLGISKSYQDKMESGLKTWRDLAVNNIQWGFVLAQKTKKVEGVY